MRYALYKMIDDVAHHTGKEFDSAYHARNARAVANRDEEGHVYALHTGKTHPPILPWGERLWADPKRRK